MLDDSPLEVGQRARRPDDAMRLEGEVAVVTGSARRIGRALGMRYAAEDACCVMADIDDAAAGSSGPDRRPGRPGAELHLNLLVGSDDADYVAGQSVNLDGGHRLN